MDNQEQSNSVERISIAVDGTEANGSIGIISLSDDGQLIPFESDATNLADTDTNNTTDIFVYDSDESVELISLATDGTLANGSSSNAVISGNGSYVTFNSSATNLVDNDTNDLRDIFLRDRNSETTELISVASDGTAANGLSLISDLSDNGDYLAFQSFASNLVNGDTNSVADIFLRDRVNSTTELVSVSPEGTAANAASELGSISDDGRYVSFISAANNLVADDRNNAGDIFVYDRDSETTTLASVGLESASADAESREGLISGNGRYVVYESDASNLVENDTNSASDIFVYDLVDETTRLVSLTNAGESANGSSTNASISDDGRYVAFLSDADNLVEGDTNSGTDIFIRDLEAETTTKIEGDSFPLLSGNGEALVFNSSSSESSDFSFVELANTIEKPDPDPDSDPDSDPNPDPNSDPDFVDRLSIDSLRRFYNSQGGYHLYSVGDGDTPILSPLSAIDPDSLSDESEKFGVLTSNLDALTGEELEDVGIVSVYQFFNSDTDAYLYTTDETEIDFVDTLDNYGDSDVAFYAFESEPTEIETIPVFRMLNTSTGAHFYTADQNELNFIQDNLNNFEMENQGEAVFYVPEL